MRSTEQEEALQWLCRLEEAAVQKNVKTRLLDAIRDCKRELEPELTGQEFRAKMSELEELLEQVKKQIAPESKEQSPANDIARKISQILEGCKQSNELLRKEYCGGSLTYIQEAERSMMELANVRANYDEVTNEERFLNIFHNIGQKYKQQMDNHAEQYIQAADGNYQNAFDRLKNLFSATGYINDAEHKFYHTYYKDQDSLTTNTKEYTRGIEKGEGSITECGKELKEPLQKLLNRIKKRAALQKMIPIIVILAVIVLRVAGNVVLSHIEDSYAQEQAEEQTIEQEDTGGLLGELANFITDKTADKGADEVSTKIMSKLLPIGIAFLFIIIALYWLWCRGIDKRCHNRIINSAGSFLEIDIGKWIQQRKLMPIVEEGFGMIDSYMNQQYGKLMAELIPNEKGTNSEESDFTQLIADWENIKRKVEF